MEKVKTLQQEYPMASIRELAEEAGLDTRTIRKLISEGELHAIYLGNSIRVLRIDWKKFLEERRDTARQLDPKRVKAGKKSAEARKNSSPNNQGDSQTLLVDQK